MSEELPVFTRNQSSCFTNARVICETLTLGNNDCRHQVDRQSVPFRDHEEHTAVIEPDLNDADAQLVQNTSVQDCGKPASGHESCGNIENPGPLNDIKQKLALTTRRQRRAIPPWFQKLSLCECKISDVTDPGRRSDRPLHGTVPRSSVLLPHSGPILLPIGGQSGSFKMCSKPALLVKTSSVVSSSTPANQISLLLVEDPSSPRVNCLGRVRIKQNGQKCDPNSTSVPCDHIDLNARPLSYWIPDIMKSENKVDDTEVLDSNSIHQKGRMKLAMSRDMSMASDFDSRSNEHERGSSPFLRRQTGLRGEANLAFKCTLHKENKEGSCNEERMASHPNDQKWDAVLPLTASHSETKFCMNLQRFGSSVPNPWVIDGSREYGKAVRQSPPSDALLRMKNISSKRVQKLKLYEEDERCESTLLHDASFPHASGGLVMLPRERNLLSVEPHLITVCNTRPAMHSQVPIPRIQMSLWQRRGLKKPFTLEVGRPDFS